MPVPCAHCGEDIDIIIPPKHSSMYHYHGRCYSLILAQRDQHQDTRHEPQAHPPRQTALEPPTTKHD